MPNVPRERWIVVLAFGAVLAAGALLTEIVVAISLAAEGSLGHDSTVDSAFGTPSYIGQLFLTDHLLAFEITSIVLLLAAVGGVILGAHSRRVDSARRET